MRRGAQTPDDVLGLVNGEGAGCHDLLSSKSEQTPCCNLASIVLNSFPAVGSFILGGLRRGPRTSCFSGRRGIYCVVTTRHITCLSSPKLHTSESKITADHPYFEAYSILSHVEVVQCVLICPTAEPDTQSVRRTSTMGSIPHG